MAGARIPRGRAAGCTLLPAHKAAGQGALGAAVTARHRSRGATHSTHSHAARNACRHAACGGPVQAQPAHQAPAVAGMPGAFGEQAHAGELRVAHPRLAAVRDHGRAFARVVPAAGKVRARHPLPVLGRRERGSHAPAGGGPPHVAGHGHGHAARRRKRPQREVVHHMVGVVVVELRLQLGEYGRQAFLLEPQACALALELAAIHAPAAVARLAIALAGAELDQRVGIGRQAQRHVGIPLVPLRRHGPAVAVPVILPVGMVGRHAGVEALVAHGQVHVLVVAAGGARQRAGAEAHAAVAQVGPLAIETHGAGRCARPPEHGLRPFDHGEHVVGLRRDVRAGRVHARRAGAQQRGAVGQDGQARAELPAKDRVAVGAAGADGREARNALEVVGRIAGRRRLARLLGIGHHGDGGGVVYGGDDHLLQGPRIARGRRSGRLRLHGQRMAQQRRRKTWRGAAGESGTGSLGETVNGMHGQALVEHARRTTIRPRRACLQWKGKAGIRTGRWHATGGARRPGRALCEACSPSFCQMCCDAPGPSTRRQTTLGCGPSEAWQRRGWPMRIAT